MDDGAMPIVEFGKYVDLLEKNWSDQIGGSVSEKMRASAQIMMRIESQREYSLEKAEAIGQFCKTILEQENPGSQVTIGQKERPFRRR